MREMKMGGLLVIVAGLSLLLGTAVGCEGDESGPEEVRATVLPALEPTVAPRPPIPTRLPTAEPMPLSTVGLVASATVAPLPTAVPTEYPTPTATATFAPEEMAVERMSEFLPWSVEPPDSRHEGVLSLLVELWLFDAGFAEDLVWRDWVADGVSSEESAAIAAIAALAYEDLGMAMNVVGLQGVSSGGSADSLAAVHAIRELFEADAELTQDVLALEWAVDGINGEELGMVNALADVAEADAKVGRLLFEIPWLTDDVTSGELQALLGILDVARRDREVGRLIWELPWIGDGVEPDSSELATLQALVAVAEVAGDLAVEVLGFEWVTDYPNRYSAEVLDAVGSTLSDLNQRSPAMSAEFVKHLGSLYIRNVLDLNGFRRVVDLIAADAETGLLALGLPWVGDTLLVWEAELLAKVEDVVASNREIGGIVLEMPWIADGVDQPESARMEQLLGILVENPNLADEIAFWPWVRDELTNQEVDGIGEIVLFHNEMIGERQSILANELLGYAKELRIKSLTEVAAISVLLEIARADIDLALRSLRLNWLVDGVTVEELKLLRFVASLADDDPSMARRFVELSWVTEGRTDVDPALVVALLPLLEADSDLGEIALVWDWERDGVGEFDVVPYRRAAELLGKLARLDNAMAYKVFELTWFSDDRVGVAEESALEILVTWTIELAPSDRDLVERVIGFVGGLSFERELDATGLERWLEVVRVDKTTLGIVRESAWLSDGITDDEARALFEISEYSEASPILGGFALGLPWVVDGIAEHETSALDAVLRLGLEDPVLAGRISELPWVMDGVYPGFPDDQALLQLARISMVDQGRARLVAEFDWIREAVGRTEVLALHDVGNSLEYLAAQETRYADRYMSFASRVDFDSRSWADIFFELGNVISDDVSTGQGVLDTQFFDDDDFSEHEVSGLREVVRYMDWDPEFGVTVASFDWVADGVDVWEQDALVRVSEFFEIEPGLAAKAADVAWIVDPSQEDFGGQIESMTQLLEIAEMDPEFAGEMMDWDWIQDDLSYAEPELLEILYAIVTFDPAIARQLTLVVADGFERVDADTFQIADATLFLGIHDVELTRSLLGNAEGWTPKMTRFVMGSVREFIYDRPEELDRLLRQYWYLDGLNEDEAVYLGALGDGVHDLDEEGDSFFEDMLRSHHIQKQRVTLPLGGEATVWVVKHRAFRRGQDMAYIIGQLAKDLEEFFGQPFPTTDIIVVIAEGNSPRSTVNTGDHIFLRTDLSVTTIDTVQIKELLTEYYLRDRVGKVWLAESAVGFLRSFPDERSFSSRSGYHEEFRTDGVRRSCLYLYGIESIQEALDYEDTGHRVKYCVERLGDLMVFKMFEVMGWDAMGRALGEVHEKSISILEVDNAGRYSVSEASLHASIERNAPRSAETEVRGLYERLHGGRFLHPAEPVEQIDSYPDEVRGSLLSTTRWRERFVRDPADETFLLALGALAEIWEIDRQLGHDVAELLWVYRGPNHVLIETLRKFARLAELDLDLAEYLAQLPSMDSGSVVQARHTIDAVVKLAQTDVSFAWEVARSDWVNGPWNDPTRMFLQALGDFGAADIDSARKIMQSRWASELGLTTIDEDAIQALRWVVLIEPELLGHIVEYNWLAFGAYRLGKPDDSWGLLEQIGKIAQIDSELALEVATMRGIRFENTAEGDQVLQTLRSIALEDLALAKRLARSSWLRGRITSDEVGRLRVIYRDLPRD